MAVMGYDWAQSLIIKLLEINTDNDWFKTSWFEKRCLGDAFVEKGGGFTDSYWEQMVIVVDGLDEEDKVHNFKSSSSVGKEGAFIAPSTAISTEQST